MKPIMLRAIAVTACLTLTACGLGPATKPSTGVTDCAGFMRSITFEDYLSRQSEEDLVEKDLLPQFYQAPMAAMKSRSRADDGKIELNILVLSGGGQWGAYGAGFINGWSELQRRVPGSKPWMAREEVDIVTGISTGAMQSSLAFAGIDPSNRTSADDNLRVNYTPERTEDIIKERNILMVLLSGGNGTFDPSPLEKSVNEMVGKFGPVIDQLPDDRQLVVGLVNVRTGRLHLADMRKTLQANRPDCYEEFLLGSSAVPGTFPPRFIDGDMYVDGGARLGLFLPLFWENLAYQSKQNNIDPSEVRVKILTIVNGSLSANSEAMCDHNPDACPEKKNKLLPIAMRSVDTLIDTVYNFSAFVVRKRAEEFGFNTEFRMAFASLDILQLGGCEKNGHFDPVFMKCLYQLGFDDGLNQTWRDPFADNWRDEDEE